MPGLEQMIRAGTRNRESSKDFFNLSPNPQNESYSKANQNEIDHKQTEVKLAASIGRCYLYIKCREKSLLQTTTV